MFELGHLFSNIYVFALSQVCSITNKNVWKTGMFEKNGEEKDHDYPEWRTIMNQKTPRSTALGARRLDILNISSTIPNGLISVPSKSNNKRITLSDFSFDF